MAIASTGPNTIRVLHIDDDPEFADMAAGFLERENERFDVETATSAAAGLDRLGDATFDCIVSDYDMPGQNGIEFLKAVREEDTDLPFILYTGHGSEDVASDAISAGVTDYLQKKTGVDQYTILANRIENAVENLRTQRALEQQNERLQTVVSNIPVIVFALDPDGMFTLSEGQRLSEVGLEPGEIVGQSVFDVYGDHDGIVSDVERALSGERVEVVREVGGTVFDTTYQPVFDDGDLRAVIGVSIDITDHRERERELERQNERLEEFAGIVSHDLRNPLNVAEGHIELARDEPESDHLNTAAAAIDRSLELIDDLLALAQGGDALGDTEPIALSEFLELCWRDVETDQATLGVETDRELRADRSRFRQLVQNLFTNAIEHGGPEVTVRVGVLDGGFYVEDDGPGIPADQRDEVFEAGYSTAEEGTGFGLPIVQEIVNAHGWELSLTEGTDGGARFEVTGVEETD